MKKSKQPNNHVDIHRIVILGSSGFIGTHLYNYLIKKYITIPVIGFSYPEIDLTKSSDLNKLDGYFNSKTAIVMLSGIKPSIQNDLESCQKNIAMAINIARYISKKRIKRFIFVSSAAVYGEDIHNLSINENTIPQPRSFYGISKYVTEKILKISISQNKFISLVIVRPPVIYGPNEQSVSYNPAGFVRKVQLNQCITIWGDGTEKREFLYVSDAIELLEAFIFNHFSGVVNIASGVSYSFMDIIKEIKGLTKHKIIIEKRERTKKKIDNQFDNLLINKIVPNFNFTTLKQGIKKCMENKYYV